eukprot:93422-Rhodomonas_salina.4
MWPWIASPQTSPPVSFASEHLQVQLQESVNPRSEPHLPFSDIKTPTRRYHGEAHGNEEEKLVRGGRGLLCATVVYRRVPDVHVTWPGGDVSVA